MNPLSPKPPEFLDVKSRILDSPTFTEKDYVQFVPSGANEIYKQAEALADLESQHSFFLETFASKDLPSSLRVFLWPKVSGIIMENNKGQLKEFSPLVSTPVEQDYANPQDFKRQLTQYQLAQLNMNMRLDHDFVQGDILSVFLLDHQNFLSSSEYSQVILYKVSSWLRRSGQIDTKFLSLLDSIEWEHVRLDYRSVILLRITEALSSTEFNLCFQDFSSEIKTLLEDPKIPLEEKRRQETLAEARTIMHHPDKESTGYNQEKKRVVSKLEALNLYEEVGEILLAEARDILNLSAAQQAENIFKKLDLDFHTAEAVLERLWIQSKKSKHDKGKIMSELVTHWRVLEDKLGESLAIFYAELDKFIALHSGSLQIDTLLRPEALWNEKLLEFVKERVPPNIKKLVQLILYLCFKPGDDALGVFNKLSNAYWEHSNTKKSVEYTLRQCRFFTKEELESLGKIWQGASLETWLNTIGIPLIPQADDVHNFAVAFSDKADISSNSLSLNGGRPLGMLAVSRGSFNNPSFAFTGFPLDDLESSGTQSLEPHKLKISDCMECGNLGTFSIARQEVIQDLLVQAAQKILDNQCLYGIMVTHKAAEMMFRRLKLSKGEDYFILDEHLNFRMKPREYDKGKMREFCKEEYGFDDHLIDSIWQNYISNPRLPVSPYIVNAKKLLAKFTILD